MPQMKTHRGAAKRFRKTAKGYKHRQTNRNHILTKKGTKRKRQHRNMVDVSPAEVKMVARMLPTKSR